MGRAANQNFLQKIFKTRGKLDFDTQAESMYDMLHTAVLVLHD